MKNLYFENKIFELPERTQPHEKKLSINDLPLEANERVTLKEILSQYNIDPREIDKIEELDYTDRVMKLLELQDDGIIDLREIAKSFRVNEDTIEARSILDALFYLNTDKDQVKQLESLLFEESNKIIGLDKTNSVVPEDIFIDNFLTYLTYKYFAKYGASDNLAVQLNGILPTLSQRLIELVLIPGRFTPKYQELIDKTQRLQKYNERVDSFNERIYTYFDKIADTFNKAISFPFKPIISRLKSRFASIKTTEIQPIQSYNTILPRISAEGEKMSIFANIFLIESFLKGRSMPSSYSYGDQVNIKDIKELDIDTFPQHIYNVIRYISEIKDFSNKIYRHRLVLQGLYDQGGIEVHEYFEQISKLDKISTEIKNFITSNEDFFSTVFTNLIFIDVAGAENIPMELDNKLKHRKLELSNIRGRIFLRRLLNNLNTDTIAEKRKISDIEEM